MRSSWLATLSLGSLGCLFLGQLGCDDALVPSPFTDGRESADAGPATEQERADAAPPPRGVGGGTPGVVFGAPCVDDAQCDDGLDCTVGVCDPESSVCRFTADDAR